MYGYEEIYQEAKSVAERAMSLSPVTASRFAVQYYQQMQPAMEMEDVLQVFRSAFLAKLKENEEYDEDVEEEEAENEE